ALVVRTIPTCDQQSAARKPGPVPGFCFSGQRCQAATGGSCPGPLGLDGSGGRPCRARARWHSGLSWPFSPWNGNSRQVLERCSWTGRRAELPAAPCGATQRGCGWLVPRMQLRCGVTCSIRRSGTVPPGAESASPQQKETRKVAQQAPQSRQGDISLIAWRSSIHSGGANFYACRVGYHKGATQIFPVRIIHCPRPAISLLPSGLDLSPYGSC